MIRVLIISCLFCIPAFCQTPSSPATATGPCSLANTGDKNTFTINCGVRKEQGQKMLEILNKILANQIDPKMVMDKLDEIINDVNPNRPHLTYFCNGRWKRTGPSANAAFDIAVGGDDSVFLKMVKLNNSGQYKELLSVCLDQMKSNPDWLTPQLFCSLAYLVAGQKDKARQMLKDFDSKTGPAYEVGACKQISDHLHEQLLN